HAASAGLAAPPRRPGHRSVDAAAAAADVACLYELLRRGADRAHARRARAAPPARAAAAGGKPHGRRHHAGGALMAAFFAMGVYAAYIWPAYGVTALVLVLLAVVSAAGERRARKQLAAIEQRSPRRRRA